jgi:hypothetical protein
MHDARQRFTLDELHSRTRGPRCHGLLIRRGARSSPCHLAWPRYVPTRVIHDFRNNCLTREVTLRMIHTAARRMRVRAGTCPTSLGSSSGNSNTSHRRGIGSLPATRSDLHDGYSEPFFLRYLSACHLLAKRERPTSVACSSCWSRVRKSPGSARLSSPTTPQT